MKLAKRLVFALETSELFIYYAEILKILFRVKVICTSFFFLIFVCSGLELQVKFQVFEARVLTRPGPVGTARSPGLFQSGGRGGRLSASVTLHSVESPT